jgi:tetratricopeptide (TPR) repeat protein
MSTALLLALVALAVSVIAFLRLYLGTEPYWSDGPLWTAIWMLALLPVIWVVVTVFCMRDAFKRSSGKQILVALVLLAPTGVLFGATISDRFWSHRPFSVPQPKEAPRRPPEFPTRKQINKAIEMVTYARQGQFQHAIDTGTAALKNDPSDTYLLEEIAAVYLRRGQRDNEHRERWVSEEAAYLDRTISIDPENKFPEKFYAVGDGFEKAGDLATSRRCFYYRRSLGGLEKEARLLADHTLANEGVAGYQIKYRNEATLARVKTKMAKANCK